ncbi:MAG: cyclic nucleotide-binding domain-containing protein [Elusimicrobia bacterium]|nr:cyclic nucleotide-binding domain-containing protein [Elusimicrobiota bacterium]
MSDIERLRQIPLFRGLSDAMLGEFSGYFKQTAYAGGDVIFREKTSGDSLYIVVSGEVVIEKALDAEGASFKTLAILSGGDFFGEMAVIEGQPRFAQARASAETSLYEVGRQQFFSFIKEHPETGISIFSSIMRTVMRRLQHTSSELTMLFDLSRLLTQQHKSPGEFFSRVMDEARIYLEGSWNVTGYVFNVFNDEYEQVYSRDAFPRQGEPAPLPAHPEGGWRDDNAYVMLCAAEGRRLACAVFERSEKVSPVEKNNLATIFNTISSIAGSAMINIEHQAEAAMLEKLRKSKNTI